jgi:hypothetical protein
MQHYWTQDILLLHTVMITYIPFTESFFFFLPKCQEMKGKFHTPNIVSRRESVKKWQNNEPRFIFFKFFLLILWSVLYYETAWQLAQTVAAALVVRGITPLKS